MVCVLRLTFEKDGGFTCIAFNEPAFNYLHFRKHCRNMNKPVVSYVTPVNECILSYDNTWNLFWAQTPKKERLCNFLYLVPAAQQDRSTRRDSIRIRFSSNLSLLSADELYRYVHLVIIYETRIVADGMNIRIRVQ